MKIWHISDTHTFHESLDIPKNIDIVIFSGDCSNPRDLLTNEREVRNFIIWFSKLPIKYKVFIAGNHDVSIEAGYITENNFKQAGIIYLENSSIELEFPNRWQQIANYNKVGSTIVPNDKIKIWGSPYTPNFGLGWAYNLKRDKLHDLWKNISEDTDIVVSHGPPKGILDLSFDRDDNLEFCGCEALRKRMLIIKPKLVCFGHIHSMSGIVNAGYIKQADHDTIYSNGSVVLDGRFDKGAVTNGNIFEL